MYEQSNTHTYHADMIDDQHENTNMLVFDCKVYETVHSVYK